MDDKEFLEKACQHEDYTDLLERFPDGVDEHLLEIKKGERKAEEYYEYSFVVERDCFGENPCLEDFFKDIKAVFDKYEDKGVLENGWDTKGGGSPHGFRIAEDVLAEID